VVNKTALNNDRISFENRRVGNVAVFITSSFLTTIAVVKFISPSL